MTLLNAPKYDAAKERRRTGLIVGLIVLLFASAILGVAGFLLGHGWFFTNLKAEHRVDQFFTALETKDYEKAYGIWMNDAEWKQHPQKYDYNLKRFTEDWTEYSPVGAITSHHVDISKTDGKGYFGTGIIVAVRVNGGQKLFMWYEKKDGTLTYPAPHELQYN